MEQNKNIYTIGYAAYTIESIIEVLAKFKITAIADVRSQPYSKFKPEFNKENLRKVLRTHGIEYVFLGDNMGARIKAPECYKNNQVDYELVSQHPLFQTGIERLLKGMEKYSIALMCAEKDPITCHRTILICRYLKKYQINIYHILDNNTLEDNSVAEFRLMKLFKLDQPDLFRNDSERLLEAYSLQEENIAYVAEHAMDYGTNNIRV